MILHQTPSGKVELVFDGVCLKLQFNGSCTEMIPFCKALCCRLRTTFTVILREEEVGKFESKPHPHSPHLQILQNKEDGSCTYLTEKDLCRVHEDKPWSCQKYHCSPGGVGEGIEHRDGGWLLTPFKEFENIDDKGTIIDFNALRLIKRKDEKE